MSRLPVDQVIPDLLRALTSAPGAVLQSPPGSGKTSRVPLALLDAPFLRDKRIVMLEPRRLAAVNAATWLARSIGEEVGGTVGYAIRFQRKVSARTRLEVLTEGLLVRRLQNDPSLDGIGAVVFDEFHERSIAADTALAFCLEVQKTLRPDLKIVVMSATLDAGGLARLLGDLPIIRAEGKSYPVALRYLGEPPGQLVPAVIQAISRALAEAQGDILVFLPGSGEIRRCHQQLRDAPPVRDLLVVPLYGDLPFAEQERAILPEDRRKVVLATNIAETSLTIEGIGLVIDSGLTRRLQFDPSSGLNRLVTVRVSAASATQRAGRAGRLGPGTCFRLWSEAGNAALVPFNPPEIRIAELSPLALELVNWGVSDPLALSWLDPPPSGALAEGRVLLTALGGLDRQGRITPCGRRMAELPLHPRLARMVLAGAERGQAGLACDLAALLEERDIFRRDRQESLAVSGCDYLDRVEALEVWRMHGSGRNDPHLDPQACAVVQRTAERLRRLIGAPARGPEPDNDEIGLLLAHAFPDRIARQREPGSDRYLLANGTGGRLGTRSALRDRQFIVAVEINAGAGGDGLIHGASSLSPELLRREFAEEIRTERRVGWDAEQGRVWVREEERLGELVLSSRPVTPGDAESSALLLEVIRADEELALLPWTPACRQLQARVALLARVAPEREWPDIGNAALATRLDDLLGSSLRGCRTASDLQRIDLAGLLKGLFSWEQQRQLDEGAPTHLTVPSGSRLPLDYESGVPVLCVKLQELFGCADTPTVAWGRVAVLLHLLSPARRPVQVTNDLRSFWDSTYPQVKKELKGRYPKHPWPDDPWRAAPTRKTRNQQEKTPGRA
ncbi:MAG: ATP-dependent helicase HrpB [Geobacter sp.]|nr:ATP-dependent helicase HrpB [Geobacter sp.]